VGSDLEKSKLGMDIEQAARAKPNPTAAATRRAVLGLTVIPHHLSCPRRTLRARPGGRNLGTLSPAVAGKDKVNHRLTFCGRYPTSVDVASLAPNAEVMVYPWLLLTRRDCG
jgi:hypothetical protein